MIKSGIYTIYNTINGKQYIGSSRDINYRFKAHFSKLKKKIHINSHLQSAVNKYGIDIFSFNIIEECPVDKLLVREQFYIDKYDWNQLYNKTKNTTGGGSDAVAKETLLLDLEGNIVDCFSSGAALARYFNKPFIPYTTINTQSIFAKQYRVVTGSFYLKNIDVILTWSNYTSKTKHQELIRKKSQLEPKYYAKNNIGIEKFNTLSELGDFVQLSKQRVSQIINTSNNYHPESDCVLGYVKKNN